MRLCQAVGNLFGNAGKFTPSGGRITVSLHVEPHGEAQRGVVTVRDTGAGIPAETLPRVWESFVQGEQDMARSQGGLGLGLALVKGIVEMHGGTVAAASAGPGQGAEFTITLPLLPPDQVPADFPPAEPAVPAPATLHALRPALPTARKEVNETSA